MHSTTIPATTARLHGLDALRAAALLLGIALHGLMPFLPGDLWLVNDAHDALWVLLVIVPIHMFRMALFLLLAGYFGARSLARRGSADYLRDRAVRVLLPLFAFWPLVVMSLGPFIAADAARAGRPMTVGTDLTLGQLWFLWVLFECILIAVATSWLLGRTVGGARAARAAATLGRLLIAPGGVLLAAVPYAVAMVLQGRTGGIAEPTTFVPDPAGLVGYLGAFAVGWALAVTPGGLEALGRRPGVHLTVAVVLTGVSFAVVGTLGTPDAAGLVGTASLFAVASWCWVYGLTGVAVRRLTRENRVVRYLADSSYWLYLVHLPLLVAGEYLVAPLDWPVLVKIAVVWVPALAVMLLSYDLLVRDTWLGRWLNGRRYPRVIMSGGRHASQR